MRRMSSSPTRVAGGAITVAVASFGLTGCGESDGVAECVIDDGNGQFQVVDDDYCDHGGSGGVFIVSDGHHHKGARVSKSGISTYKSRSSIPAGKSGGFGKGSTGGKGGGGG